MIGIFGSAFNPPTLGHRDAISQALTFCKEVWLVPSIAHAFRKEMLPFEVRVAMVETFVRDMDDDRVKVCTLERDLWDGRSPVYTIDVTCALEELHPNDDFGLLFGPDNILALNKFEKSESLVSQCRIVSLVDRTNIRSTDVRIARKVGDQYEHMVTDGVYQFIQQEQLYVE